MKYDLSAAMFPLLFDRYAFSLLKEKGITAVQRKSVHSEYKQMVHRTPALPKGSPFTGNLLMGCYVLSFYKAAPQVIDEEILRQLIRALCLCRPMVKAHEKEDAFDENMLKQKQQDALKSQNSTHEMDWKFTYVRNDRDSYDIQYTACGLCQLGKRENCFHLIHCLCEADFLTYSMMNAELTRTHTLASGDAYCDFHIHRKKD